MGAAVAFYALNTKGKIAESKITSSQEQLNSEYHFSDKENAQISARASDEARIEIEEGEQRPKLEWTEEQRKQKIAAISARKQFKKSQAEKSNTGFLVSASNPSILANASEMGPNTSGEVWNGNSPYAGMVKEISINVSDNDLNSSNDRLVVATETGGAWISENGGANWDPVDDDWAFDELSAVSQDPHNPDSYFFGSEQSGLFHWDYANWSANGLNSSGLDFVTSTITIGNINYSQFSSVSAIRHHPTDADRFFVVGSATGNGTDLFETTDNGLSFQQIHDDYGNGIYDLIVTDDIILVASEIGIHHVKQINGVWNSTNLRAAPGGTGLSEIAINSDNPNSVYCYFLSDLPNADDKHDIYFSRSTDGGFTWSALINPMPGGVDSQRHDQALHVSKPNPTQDLIIFGQVKAYASLVYSNGLMNMNPGQRNLGHSDYQDFKKNGTDFYVANDGGIFRYNISQVQYAPPGIGDITSEESLNATFRTYQSVHVKIPPSGDDTFLSGFWHTGVIYKSNNTADLIRIGDGSQCAFKPGDPNVLYTCTQKGQIKRQTADNSDSGYFPNPNDDLYTRIFTHPQTPEALYNIIDEKMYVMPNASTANSNDSWSTLLDISPQNIKSIGMLEDDANSPIYFTDNSVTPIIYKISSLNPLDNVALTNDISNLSVNYIGPTTDIAIDPTNTNRIFIATIFRIYEVNIQGSDAIWTEINRPDNIYFFTQISVSTEDSDHLLLGTAIGLYETSNSGQSWSPVTTIPAVRIEEISVRPDGKMAIATYGRGIWMAEFDSGCALDDLVLGSFGVSKWGYSATFSSPIKNSGYDFRWTAKKLGAKYGFVMGNGSKLTYNFSSAGTYIICLTITDPNDPACFREICQSVVIGFYIQWPTKLNSEMPKDSETVQGIENMIDLQVYPNPALEFVNIEISDSFEGTILLHNIQGQMIREIPINGRKSRIELFDLLPGNYILSLADESGILSQKQIVKE